MRPSKVTQKDRYGNSVTMEFQQPMKPVDPTKLMEKSMDLQAEVPQMMSAPPAYDHPGEPRGPDTVPAWLTPGEFVMNKEGKDIMEQEAPGMLEHFNNRGRQVQAQQGGSIPEYAADGGLIGGLLQYARGNKADADMVGKAPPAPTAPAQPYVNPIPTPQELAHQKRVHELSQMSAEDFLAGQQARIAAAQAAPEYNWYDPRAYFEDGGSVPLPMHPTEALIRAREGRRNDAYTDTEGYRTAGIGHRLPQSTPEGTQFSDEQIDRWLDDDIETAQKAAKANAKHYGVNWDDLTRRQQSALTSQAFQLGETGQREFDQMWTGIADNDPEAVRREAWDSKWASQTPTRVEDLAGAWGDPSRPMKHPGAPAAPQQTEIERANALLRDAGIPTEPAPTAPEGPGFNPITAVLGAPKKIFSGLGTLFSAEGGEVDEFDEMVKHIEAGGMISPRMHQMYGKRLSEAGYMADGGPVYLEAGGQGLIPAAKGFWNDITSGPAVPSPVTIPAGTGQEHIYNRMVDQDRAATGEAIPYANEEWAAPTAGEQALGTAGVLADAAKKPYDEYWSQLNVPFTDDTTVGDVVDTAGEGITAGVDKAEDVLGVDLPGGTPPEPPAPPTAEEEAAFEEEILEEARDIDTARAELADLVKQDEADPEATTGPGEDQPGETPPPEVVEQAGNEAATTPEGKVAVEKSKGMLEGLFGDLFDKKELARMAVLAAGSMALGYSPLGSMRWAAGQYIGRLDAKAGAESAAQAELKKNAFDLAKTGKYTPESVRAYENSGGNLAALQAMEDKKQATVTGNTRKVTGPGGKSHSLQEWKAPDGSTLYQAPDGRMMTAAQVENSFRPHEPAFEKGTAEYRTRRSRALGYSEGRFKEIREGSGLLGENDGIKSYATDIPPGKAASQFWDFAERNGLDPESDGALNIMTNAYENAIADGKASGVRHTDLKPFLEQEYIREQTGNPDLFVLNVGKDGRRSYVDATKMSTLDQSVDQLARSKGVASQDIYQSLVADWGSMDDTKRQKFMDVKIPGETPFFSYMQAKMSSAYGS